ncbi:Tigger transposable element-derived protein 4 [Araneus ventricosus]|uniref:Tigger transposable element-derived protein 4 n=1 Tax=Araneus ventricosus TaxID=182803 RepID=A0A4Y2H0A5_ARAVE|nr:Tigger transposable element-derived protein 4 [Araneus ventricosus]
MIKNAPKLSQKVLYPTSFGKQKMLLALNIFHESNSAALAHGAGEKGKDTMGTKEFIYQFLKWRNIVNVKNSEKGKRLKNPFCDAIRSTDQMSMVFLNKFYDWLVSWNNKSALLLKKEKKKKGEFHIKSSETFEATSVEFEIDEELYEVFDTTTDVEISPEEMPTFIYISGNAWLERFKDGHCLSFKTICGKEAAVEGEAIEDWKNSVLKDILFRFDASNVFNLDETGLFYRLLPDKTLSFKVEKCTSGEASKQRPTLLLGANMSGNEKLVIGKSKKSRCFKNVKSLSVEYVVNSNAWMTTTIWERHIRKLDSQFSRQKRNAAIIVDKCTAHNQLENLKAIEIVFLLRNGFTENAESEEIFTEDIIDPEPLETLLQIANEKGCNVNDVNAFVSIDNDIAICSQATVKALTSEFLEQKRNS